MEGPVGLLSNLPNTDALVEIERHITTLLGGPGSKTPFVAFFRLPEELGVRAFMSNPSRGVVPSFVCAYMGMKANGNGLIDDQWLSLFKKILTCPGAHLPMVEGSVPVAHSSVSEAVEEISSIMERHIEDAVEETSYMIAYRSGDALHVKGNASTEAVYDYPTIPLLFNAFNAREESHPYVEALVDRLLFEDQWEGLRSVFESFDDMEATPLPSRSPRKRPQQRRRRIVDDDDEVHSMDEGD